MEISEVRVRLVANKDEKLKAFCSVTLDAAFVIRDIKVIEGADGYFVAMPSRKMSDHCERCGSKNHLRAKYCNNCGVSLRANRAKRDQQGRAKLHTDIAHPITAICRQQLQRKVVDAVRKEMELSQKPGYRPVEMDVDLED